MESLIPLNLKQTNERKNMSNFFHSRSRSPKPKSWKKKLKWPRPSCPQIDIIQKWWIATPKVKNHFRIKNNYKIATPKVKNHFRIKNNCEIKNNYEIIINYEIENNYKIENKLKNWRVEKNFKVEKIFKVETIFKCNIYFFLPKTLWW